MAFVFVFFASLLVRTSVSVSPFEENLQKSEPSLGERVNRLEQLVIRQDLLIRQFEREKDLLAREKEQCAGLRTEWGKSQQQWQLEKQALKDEIAAMILTRASYGDTTNHAKTSIHGVVLRSDDAAPLEAVLTQVAQRLTEVSGEVQTLKNSHANDIQALRIAILHQDQAIQEAASSVYIRWGNSACPNSTSLVYSGVIGGSHSGEVGGAANPLCLSMSPVPGPGYRPGGYSALYGAEYQTYDSHADKDPVCAVCRSPRPTVVMIPATNRCQSGWTTEYSGFLMAGNWAQTAPTEYICVDSKFESRIGGDQDARSYTLYFTEAHCAGSLPCQPYVDGSVVTCAVCSK